MADIENETSSTKVNGFIEKNKKLLIFVLCAIIVCLIAFIIYTNVAASSKQKALSAIDEISYTLTNESASLEKSELDARRYDAKELLQAYVNKGGIVGTRANFLCAEIAYQEGKYEDAINYYKATAEKGKKTYIAPVANYNLASCYEKTGDLVQAAVNYKLAAENKDFALAPHAKFSYARVVEAQKNFVEAKIAYTELYETYPNDNWGKLAKTRLIALGDEGKAE